MNEIHSQLKVDVGGVILFLDENAIPARLTEWLQTPEGAVWGWPQWGNPMKRFSHDPTNENTAIAIEAYLINKLRTDVPDLKLIGIRCEAIQSDMYRVQFFHQSGAYEIFMQSESAQ